MFNCPKSQLYVEAPFHGISRLSTSFSLHRKGDWDFLCNLNLVVHRLVLTDLSGPSEVLKDLTRPGKVNKSLHTLILKWFDDIPPPLDGLGYCQALHTLTLFDCCHLTHVDELANCQSLRTLAIRKCFRLSDVNGLGNCQSLRTLSINGCRELTQLDALSRCQALHTLELFDCGVPHLNGLAPKSGAAHRYY